MARVTEAQRIEHANEEAALVFFREALWLLPDPRRRQGIRYPLRSVVVISGGIQAHGQGPRAHRDALN